VKNNAQLFLKKSAKIVDKVSIMVDTLTIRGNHPRDEKRKTTMKITIKNEFHGYEKTIEGRNGGIPAISSVEKAIRESKPSDCTSLTKCYEDDTGREVVIFDRGYRKDLLWRDTFDEVR
jgi:hypothetical protein